MGTLNFDTPENGAKKEEQPMQEDQLIVVVLQYLDRICESIEQNTRANERIADALENFSLDESEPLDENE